MASICRLAPARARRRIAREALGDFTMTRDTITPDRKQEWRMPTMRAIPARAAQMPTGKPGSGADLGSFS
jgi:hypothetical protein